MNTRNENTDCLWKMNWYKKGERAVIPKMMYSEFQGGGGDSLQTTLYALQDETCMGQLSLEKRRNHQKFCISAKYKSKLTEICFLVMHLV